MPTRGRISFACLTSLLKISTTKKNEDGKKKWTLIKDTISPKTSRILGEGINNARHTFTSSAESLGTISDDDQRKMLGQKAKGALSHYQSPAQMRIDLNHIKP